MRPGRAARGKKYARNVLQILLRFGAAIDILILSHSDCYRVIDEAE